jgi:hypothetical protein
MENGEWRIQNGEWRMENGEWGIEKQRSENEAVKSTKSAGPIFAFSLVHVSIL